MLGADHIMVKCQDGKERLCRIRGKLKRRVWIREGDIVLVSPWIFKPKAGETFSGDIEKTSLTGLEPQLPNNVERLKNNLKCTECGNTFQKERLTEGELVTCPVCDANYKVTIKDQKYTSRISSLKRKI